jgi:hypothetical protein
MKILFLIIASFLFAIGTSSAQNTPETVTNKTIIALQKAGIGSSTMQSMIATSPCQFDTDSKSIIELKQNGVPDDVITAMVGKTSHAIQTAVPTSAEPATGIVGQLKSQGTGIYILKETQQLEDLEPTVYSSSKRGSGILTSMTDGLAKTKNKMAVTGSKANLQLTNRRPVFYFYFYNAGGTLNDQSPKWFANATSPNEFVLVKFDQSRNGKAREVVTGTYNIIQGNVAGVDDDNKRTFQFKKVERGIYQVYFDQDLSVGEYCFMYAGSMSVDGVSNPKVYDFGIQ